METMNRMNFGVRKYRIPEEGRDREWQNFGNNRLSKDEKHGKKRREDTTDSAGPQHRDLVERESDGNYLHTVK